MSHYRTWYEDSNVFDIDSQLDDLNIQVRDPFQFGMESSFTTIEMCVDTVVAGISERLGLPEGLSFEVVFNCIC